MTQIPEHLLARAQKARERAERAELSKEDEQYVADVMTELKRLQDKDMTGTDKPAELQRSDNVTYWPGGGPNTSPGIYTNPPTPSPTWITPPTQIKPPSRTPRSFTETYNKGLELAREAATLFEDQTGQTISQLVMATLAVEIAKRLENW